MREGTSRKEKSVMWKTLGVYIVFFLLYGKGDAHAFEPCCGTGNDSIYTSVDKIPQFDGGSRGWKTFLTRNLDVSGLQSVVDEDFYKEFGWVQRAVLEFTVCHDGRICGVEVVNAEKLPPEVVDEVFRVMGNSPRWKPAERKGRPVTTRFRQTITVDLRVT